MEYQELEKEAPIAVVQSKPIIKTSQNDAETAAKIKQISHMLMVQNKNAYRELANMP